MDALPAGSSSIGPDSAPRKRDASHIGSNASNDAEPQSTTSKRRKTEEKVGSVNPNTAALITELNEEIKDALYGNIYDDEELSEGIHDSQIGATIWSRNEKLRFFNALAIYGRDDISNIAAAVGKSMPETRAYLLVLEDATLEYKLTVGVQQAALDMRSVPAAVELSKPLIGKLSRCAVKVEHKKMRLEEIAERRIYGRYWLLDSKIAQEASEAYLEVRLREQHQQRHVDKKRLSNNKNDTQTISHDKMEVDKRQSTPISTEHSPSNSFESVSTKSGPQSNNEQNSNPDDQESNEETSSSYSSDSSSSDTDSDSSLDISQDESTESLPELLRCIPAANLLNLTAFLRLSNRIFMNLPLNKSFLVQEKAIRHTAFADLHAITVSLTRRIISTAIFQANSRIRLHRYVAKNGKLKRHVSAKDIFAALDILGMKRDSFEFWRDAPRRLSLTCRTSIPSSSLKFEAHLPKSSNISLEQAEQVLGKLVWKQWHPGYHYRHDEEGTEDALEEEISENDDDDSDDSDDGSDNEDIIHQDIDTLEPQSQEQYDNSSHLISSEDEAHLSSSSDHLEETISDSSSEDSIESTSSSDSDSASSSNGSSLTPSELDSLYTTIYNQAEMTTNSTLLQAQHQALRDDLSAHAKEESILNVFDAAASAREEDRLSHALVLNEESRADRRARLAAEKIERATRKAEKQWSTSAARKGIFTDREAYVKRLLNGPLNLKGEGVAGLEEFVLGPNGRPVMRDGRPVRIGPEEPAQNEEIVQPATSIITYFPSWTITPVGPSTEIEQEQENEQEPDNEEPDNEESDNEELSLKFLDPDQSSGWRDVVDYRAPWEEECIMGNRSITKSQKGKNRA
jgi:hypothetical protein